MKKIYPAKHAEGYTTADFHNMEGYGQCIGFDPNYQIYPIYLKPADYELRQAQWKAETQAWLVAMYEAMEAGE